MKLKYGFLVCVSPQHQTGWLTFLCQVFLQTLSPQVGLVSASVVNASTTSSAYLCPGTSKQLLFTWSPALSFYKINMWVDCGILAKHREAK